MLNIAVINESTITTDAQVEEIVKALQIQVDRDFGPLWDVDARLAFVGKNALAHPSFWQLVILDTSDQAGALGYHDMTAADKPLGKVFALSDKEAGDKLSVTMSHELLEMLGDPYINLTVQNTDGLLYAYENCDAVEDDSLGYDIEVPGGKVTVSDFVLRSWFVPEFRGRVDFCNHLTQAFSLAAGGYIGTLDPSTISPENPFGIWTQKTAFRYAPIRKAAAVIKGALQARSAITPPVGSRRERRVTGVRHYLTSTAQASPETLPLVQHAAPTTPPATK